MYCCAIKNEKNLINYLGPTGIRLCTLNKCPRFTGVANVGPQGNNTKHDLWAQVKLELIFCWRWSIAAFSNVGMRAMVEAAVKVGWHETVVTVPEAGSWVTWCHRF
jgi:hypothetical protein